MRSPRRFAARAWMGAVAVGALVLAGCGSSESPEPDTPDTGASATDTFEQLADAPAGEHADELSGTLTVFAAASLKATFDQLREDFMAAHPGVDFPEITYEGSATLVTQLQEGAPADVFASADQNNMDKVPDLVTGRVDFAANMLQIAVAPGNPKGVTSLADIAADGMITVICAAPVPCGNASHKALDAAGVDLTPASEEENVKSVLTKVASGDADAGLVYATDVFSSDGKVEGIEFPEAAGAVNVYPIAMLSESLSPAAAQAFIDLVTSPEGQQVLAGVGFAAP